MLKICCKSIINPLLIIYKKLLEKGCFPNKWKKANVVPVHEKKDKQLLKNYQPISLLPICGKILERLLYNSMFEFFIQNNLILLTDDDIAGGHLGTPGHHGYVLGKEAISLAKTIFL